MFYLTPMHTLASIFIIGLLTALSEQHPEPLMIRT